MKILVTIDGSPESQAVLPVVTKLAKEASASVLLLTVLEPKGATPSGHQRQAHFISGRTVSTGIQAPATVVRTIDTPAETTDQAMQRILSEGREFLDDAVSSLAPIGVAFEMHVAVDENAARAILEFAKAQSVDLIAMATHGRSGLRQAVQGSVASAVVKAGVAPVLLVRPQA